VSAAAFLVGGLLELHGMQRSGVRLPLSPHFRTQLRSKMIFERLPRQAVTSLSSLSDLKPVQVRGHGTAGIRAVSPPSRLGSQTDGHSVIRAALSEWWRSLRRGASLLR
jgi:hypothetical protein